MRVLCCLLIGLGLTPILHGQLTGVSPGAADILVVSTSASGPNGPGYQGVTITLTGTGTYAIANTCFGGIKTSVPSNAGTLPATLYAWYPTVPGASCTLNFTGGSGGAGSTVLTTVGIPANQVVIDTDMAGTLTSALAYCNKPNTGYRTPATCVSQQPTIRPGGTFNMPAQGGTYQDVTYSNTITNQGVFTRNYVGSNQISFDGNYVMLWNGTNAVAHRINAPNNAQDFTNISGPGSVCGVNSTANVNFETTAALANVGYCLTSPQTTVKKFTMTTAPNATDNGIVHVHASNMSQGMWGTGNISAEGWNAHFGDDGLICVTQMRTPLFPDTCIAPVYPVRNVSISFYPSRITGKYLVVVGSDSPNRGTSYTWDPIALTLALQGQDVKIVDSPTISDTGATWNNVGSCNPAADCIVAGHRNIGWWEGEPYSCGTGNGRTQAVGFVSGGNCIRQFGWTLATGRDIDALGGPVMPQMSSYEEYYAGTANAGVFVTANSTGGQGLIPAWACYRIIGAAGVATCYLTPTVDWTAGVTALTFSTFGLKTVTAKSDTASTVSFADAFVGSRASETVTYGGWTWRFSACVGAAGTVTCTFQQNFTSSGLAAASPLYVDGGGGTWDNLRTTVSAVTAATVTWVDATVAIGAQLAGNVTFDTDITVTKPALVGVGGVRVCRPGLAHCRVIANPLGVSYGDGAGSYPGATGTWNGLFLGSPGFQSLNFIAPGQRGEQVCWVTDGGRLNTIYTACAPTGFDLDRNTLPNMFDRVGHGLYARSVTASGFTIDVKPTDGTFTCLVEVSTRRDMNGFTGLAFSGTPVGTATDRSSPVGGLAANTQYYATAKCGAGAGKVWDFGILSVRTKP